MIRYSLPQDFVSADHLSLFIRRLERVKLNQFLIGKFNVLFYVLFLYLWLYITDCIFALSKFYAWVRARSSALRVAIAPLARIL